jgi:hypothetical protein
LDLRQWLERDELAGYGFSAEFWRETEGDRDAVTKALASEIVNSYVDRDWLERRLAKLGYARVAEHLRSTVLPPPGNTRAGDFGEIVATFLISRFGRFRVPVLRLRYKDSPSGTQRLIDVVAFKFRRPPQRTVISVNEVKTRTSSAPGAAAEAADQLYIAVANLALSLSYIERRLTSEGKHWLADLVLALLADDAVFDLQQTVYLVSDQQALHS